MATLQTAEKFFLRDVPEEASARAAPTVLGTVQRPLPTLSIESPRREHCNQLELSKIRALRRYVRGKFERGHTFSQESVFRSSGWLDPLPEGQTVTRSYTEGYEHSHLGGRKGCVDAVLFPRSLPRFNSTNSLYLASSGINRDLYHGALSVNKRRSKMSSMGSSKQYHSQPQLGQRQAQLTQSSGRLPDIKSVSVPRDINLCSEETSDRLPDISTSNITTCTTGNQGRRGKQHTRSRGQKDSADATRTVAQETELNGTTDETVNRTESAECASSASGEDSEDDEDDEDEDGGFTEVERIAEEEVKHNWLLEEENKIRMKRFENRKNRLMIHISDDDTVDAIDDRLEELRMMAKPRKDERHVLDRLSKDQRERILVSSKIYQWF